MKKLSLLILLMALVLSGCEGGATASGIRDQCSHANLTGSCTLTISTLSGGAWSYRVENSALRQANGPVEVTVNVTVGTGTVNVWVEDGSNRSAVIVAAGGTAETSGTAKIEGTGNDRYFRIYFEPQGEGDAKRAENIQADITYQVP